MLMSPQLLVSKAFSSDIDDKHALLRLLEQLDELPQCQRQMNAVRGKNQSDIGGDSMSHLNRCITI